MTLENEFSEQTADILSPFLSACGDRQNALRWCNFATVDAAGHPQSRTLVLREVSVEGPLLRFYTDKRSPKCADLAQTPAVTCLFLSENARSQYRFTGLAKVLSSGDQRRTHWQKLAPHAQRDYASVSAPSRPGPTDYRIEDAEQNFALIEVRLLSLDLLTLAREQHQRWRYEWTESGLSKHALTP